jgi:hypothetical protein
LVDPYSTDEIAAAIRTIVNYTGLRAELSQRGRAQAANFLINCWDRRRRSARCCTAPQLSTA